jgi:hypothetical protein
MIQRIQSLYLTMVILISLLFFSGNIFKFADESGKVFKLMITGNMTDQAGKTFANVEYLWPLTVILILISSLALVTIMLYRNRKVQLRLAISVIVIAGCFIIAVSWYGFDLTNTFRFKIIPGFKMTLPVFNLIFSILAYRGILKDERLVKSYDRLR